MLNPKPILSAAICLATASLCTAEPRFSKLDKYETPLPFPGVRGSHITYNLGATGMRAWIDWNHPISHDTSPSREILIKSVEAGSPADGILRPYDIILGVADAPGGKPKPFTSDARLAFARAITMAESTAGRGELPMLCWRDGGTGVVTLRLPVMGDYAYAPAPDCPKTMKIVAQAADALAAWVPPAGDTGMIAAIDGMFLLASGDPRHLDPVRRIAHRIANTPIGTAGHNTWPWGNVNLFLSEYYLATGDETVLPKIAEYSQHLVDGQCNPGTWGHRGVEGRIPPGYGSVNSAGVPAFVSLVTAHQTGVDFDRSALIHSINFYGGYAGRGGIPYGDHPPTQSASDNGKNGGAAVAFHLLGAEGPAQWFARLSASSNLRAFEGGHTGNYFNQLWTPLGASLAGEANYRNFRAAFHNYRDMARRWDGTFVTQPEPNSREGDLGFGNYVRKGPAWSTSGFGLSLLGGTRELAILGRTRSVFAPAAPAALAPPLEHYRQKRFQEAYAAASALTGAADPELAELAAQLARAAQRNTDSIQHTLAAMNESLEKGDLFLVKTRLDALAPILAADDPRLAPFQTAIRENPEIVQDGSRFHAAISNTHTISGHPGFVYFTPGPRAGTDRPSRDAIRQLAQGRESYYQQQAALWLKRIQQQEAAKNTTLIDALAINPPVTSQTFQIDNPAALTGLELTWNHNPHGGMSVILNGTPILNIDGPSGNAQTTIPLKPSTLQLLKPGGNELTVQIDTQGKPAQIAVSLVAITAR